MRSNYPACFFKDNTGYSVIFPDLDGLSTCGSTLDEAFAMAIDCLAGYLYTAGLEKEDIPMPTALGNIDPADVAKKLDFVYDEVLVNIISVDVEEYAKVHFTKSVKKTLTIPAWLNNRAKEMGINFSQVLQEALMQKLGIK